jgi:hypothetical protein
LYVCDAHRRRMLRRLTQIALARRPHQNLSTASRTLGMASRARQWH